MENRLKEIAGDLKRDVKDLLGESARVVTGMFKQGFCTANGLKKCWNTFTHGLSSIASSLSDPDFFAPRVLPEHQPLVTVKESECEDLPVGTQMPLYEAEQRIEELCRELWDADEPDKSVKVAIDYRMNDEQDRYWLPLQIGPGQGAMLTQMQQLIDSSLRNPDIVCQDFYTAAPGLSNFLHEQFGPQLRSDLEKLGDHVLGYFRQHCTISQLEQQFQTQAQAMPVKNQKRFQEYARTTITALRRATNTGQELPSPQREQQEQAAPAAPDHQPEQGGNQKPRQSVKVQLRQIREGQSKKSTLRKSRNDRQR